MTVDGKILIKNDEGKDILCDVLFTFDSDETKRSYIVYTDNSKDELGNIKVYANIFDSFSDSGDLLPIETKEEWDTIEQIFNSINENNEGVDK